MVFPNAYQCVRGPIYQHSNIPTQTYIHEPSLLSSTLFESILLCLLTKSLKSKISEHCTCTDPGLPNLSFELIDTDGFISTTIFFFSFLTELVFFLFFFLRKVNIQSRHRIESINIENKNWSHLFSVACVYSMFNVLLCTI